MTNSERAFMWPYQMGSQGAKQLAQALGIKRTQRWVRANRNKVVINWGCSYIPAFPFRSPRTIIVNSPGTVKIAADKARTLYHIKNLVRLPARPLTVPWVTSWDNIPTDWSKVVARTVLTGHSGEGVVIGTKDEVPKDCQLYTKYLGRRQEWRVHVVERQVIDVQRKARRRGVETNWQVRSHDNGWVYCRQGIEGVHPDLGVEAIRAVHGLGLTFGAVDLVVPEEDPRPYVLEINTAPGLEGQTIEKYRAALETIILRMRS